MWERIWGFVFGEAAPEKLPARVQRSIGQAQDRAEQLISWIQLILVMIFALLYLVAPKPGAGADIQPVPIALAIYFSFTVLRLWVAMRDRLPDWLLMLSIVLDMAFLMALIWSFHIQYDQPPTFYLKAPTLIYVFIFIALRALRFDPRHILLAGLAAIVGWSILMAYVVFRDPMDTMITRDYVTYLTSNAILIGAEVDKLIAIAMVTAILAVAVMRAQRVFEKDMFDAAAARDLSRFVSPEVAARITQSDHEIGEGHRELRDISVVFTDLENFSALAERLDPEQLSQVLNAYFTALSNVITAHGGVITQYQGDSMLITFNAVTDIADHADCAVKTALGIDKVCHETVFSYGVKLRTRCGVNTGEAVIGAFGARDRLVFTVHGDIVNVASRLEVLNKSYGSTILVGARTVETCSGRYDFVEMGEVALRGKSASTRAYRLDAGIPAGDAGPAGTNEKGGA